MSHKVRLGPIAIFLTVVAIVLTMLAILTFATSHADAVMAQRFASVTETRYELEAEGRQFLADADEMLANGQDLTMLEGVTRNEGSSFGYTIEKNGYSLLITVSAPENGRVQVEEWKIDKIWQEEDPYQNIWKGK